MFLTLLLIVTFVSLIYDCEHIVTIQKHRDFRYFFSKVCFNRFIFLAKNYQPHLSSKSTNFVFLEKQVKSVVHPRRKTHIYITILHSNIFYTIGI